MGEVVRREVVHGNHGDGSSVIRAQTYPAWRNPPLLYRPCFARIHRHEHFMQEISPLRAELESELAPACAGFKPRNQNARDEDRSFNPKWFFNGKGALP
ncbi:MAG TPA: hypothetical protein VID67_01800 [Rhizomicrobium sp.]